MFTLFFPKASQADMRGRGLRTNKIKNEGSPLLWTKGIDREIARERGRKVVFGGGGSFR